MLKGGFSLKIQKRETNKVQKVVKRGFEKIEEETDNAEIIKGIDSEKGIIGTKPKVEEKALVIPCIKGKVNFLMKLKANFFCYTKIRTNWSQ